ncbi:hypothetical protein [Streptosporangium sp. NPDC002607]
MLWTLFRLYKARFGPVEGRDFRLRHAELLDWARSHGRLHRAGVLHILAPGWLRWTSCVPFFARALSTAPAVPE